MATTSPDNLRSPNPGDAYNLTSDWANSMNDVQAALTLRANAYKGTASARAAFTATATDGMLWADTDSINMIWRKAGAAWVPAVWTWAGTATQMNAFSAPNGFIWRNTTDNMTYGRISGSWVGGAGTLTPASGTTISADSFMTKDPSGLVTLSARFSRSVWTGGNALFTTLPVGWRPTAARAFWAATNGAGSPIGRFCELGTDGSIRGYNLPTNGETWNYHFFTTYYPA